MIRLYGFESSEFISKSTFRLTANVSGNQSLNQVELHQGFSFSQVNPLLFPIYKALGITYPKLLDPNQLKAILMKYNFALSRALGFWEGSETRSSQNLSPEKLLEAQLSKLQEMKRNYSYQRVEGNPVDTSRKYPESDLSYLKDVLASNPKALTDVLKNDPKLVSKLIQNPDFLKSWIEKDPQGFLKAIKSDPELLKKVLGDSKVAENLWKVISQTDPQLFKKLVDDPKLLEKIASDPKAFKELLAKDPKAISKLFDILAEKPELIKKVFGSPEALNALADLLQKDPALAQKLSEAILQNPEILYNFAKVVIKSPKFLSLVVSLAGSQIIIALHNMGISVLPIVKKDPSLLRDLFITDKELAVDLVKEAPDIFKHYLKEDPEFAKDLVVGLVNDYGFDEVAPFLKMLLPTNPEVAIEFLDRDPSNFYHYLKYVATKPEREKVASYLARTISDPSQIPSGNIDAFKILLESAASVPNSDRLYKALVVYDPHLVESFLDSDPEIAEGLRKAISSEFIASLDKGQPLDSPELLRIGLKTLVLKGDKEAREAILKLAREHPGLFERTLEGASADLREKIKALMEGRTEYRTSGGTDIIK